MRLLFPGETLWDFLSRPGLYKRLRYRLRLALWEAGAGGVEPEWRLLPLLVDRQRAAVDVGANYGVYAGALCRLTKQVHCFEPIPELAEQLRRRLPPWAVVHSVAASDRAGPMTLTVPVKPDGSLATAGASVAPENLELANRTRVRKLDCQSVRLDDVIAVQVGFMKIDVEGHEFATLQGAQRILETDRPVLLIESVRVLHPRAPGHVFEFLASLNYRGLFVWAGRLHPVEVFVPEVHQPLLPGGGAGAPFAWNFMFLPA